MDGLRGPAQPAGYRRRQVLWALAGGLGTAVVLRGGRSGSIIPTPGPDLDLPLPGPTPSASPSPTTAPLPVRRTALPSRIFVEPFPSSVLSHSPVARAYALLQPAGREQIAVLGDDGWLRGIDVGGLTDTSDGQGNRSGALCSTALAPDGRRAAFGQIDRVTVVEFETGRATARSVPVPGNNERVAWLGSTVLAVQPDQSLLVGVDEAGTRVQATPYRGADVVVGGPPDGPIMELAATARPGGPAQLIIWGGDGSRGERSVSSTETLAGWVGAGWLRGRYVARAASAATGSVAAPTGPPRAIAVVVDTAVATVVRSIAAPPDLDARLEVLGWLDDETVLVYASARAQPFARILAWTVRSGSLASVATVTGPRVTVALAAG